MEQAAENLNLELSWTNDFRSVLLPALVKQQCIIGESE